MLIAITAWILGCAAALWHLSNGKPIAALAAIACAWVARRISVTRFASGAVMTCNSRGRCEDAPCCDCCS